LSSLGALLTVGIPGPTLDGETRDILAEIEPGGVILFRRNVGESSVEQIAELVAELHRLPSAPLVSIDHEGGRVMRFGAPFTHFPPAAAIGQHRDPRLAEQVGLAMARELRSVGIDLSYAPVLDVDSNPANPVIGNRSFASDPEVVTEMALALALGLQAGGVIPCGKHFPGHGDTAVDSHYDLPVVRRSRAQLEQVELRPFRAAIAAGLPMLLTAHVIYTALDSERPATLSPLIVDDLLRQQCGYDGVLGSDDLEMRAITGHRGIGVAAVAALQAGVDILLVCQTLSAALEVSRALRSAHADGRIDPEHISAAQRRVDALRAMRSFELTSCPLPCPEHRELAAALR
jgi:beta-N-acetylhexosaminidase